MEYQVYRQIVIGQKIMDSLVATVFDKEDAVLLVRSIRQRQNNQLCYYKAVNK